jgi:hypothetical protein
MCVPRSRHFQDPSDLSSFSFTLHFFFFGGIITHQRIGCQRIKASQSQDCQNPNK